MSRRIIPTLAMFMLAACQRVAAPLSHEAYVWPDQSTEGLGVALSDGAATFAVYRVIAARGDVNGQPVATRADLADLARAQRPVVAVLRLDDGTLPGDSLAVAQALDAIARAWRTAGLQVAGVEIDHDCTTAALGEYARWLRSVHASLHGLPVSIAARPAWTESPDLGKVLGSVEESVLQIDAAPQPRSGSFDAAFVQRSIEAYALASSKPFRIALAVRGRPAPEEVAKLLRGLEHERPAQLAGVVWLPLPTADDRDAWSLATLRAVIGGESLRPVVQVSFDKDETGANDLVLANRGVVDAPLPPAIVIAAFGCDAGDAHDGFRLERSGDDWRFVATEKSPLGAGRRREVGWLRCDSIGGVKIDDEHPDAPANGATRPD